MTFPAERKSFMSFWTEIEGKKGSTEIGSSMLKILGEQFMPLVDGELRTLIIYMDRCVGQNNNKYILSLLFYLVFERNLFTTVKV